MEVVWGGPDSSEAPCFGLNIVWVQYVFVLYTDVCTRHGEGIAHAYGERCCAAGG